MSRYLFFLRGHNDTDNIAPAIWFLLERNANAFADIVFYNFEFRFLDHPYVSELLGRFAQRVRLIWIGEFFDLTYDQLTQDVRKNLQQTEVIADKLRLNSESSLVNIFGKHKKKQSTLSRILAPARRPRLSRQDLISATTSIISDRRIPVAFRQELIAWVLGDAETPVVAVFDHQRGSTLLGLIGALRAAGVKRIIRLPVSPVMNINVLREANDTYVKLNADRMHEELDFSAFDDISFTDSYYPDSIGRFFLEMGWPEPFLRRPQILGSIRYCPEWLSGRPKAPPFTPATGDDDRFRLVFFLSRRRTNTYWDEVERSVHLINSFPGFRLIVQPHPRGAEPPFKVKGAQYEIAEDVSAASLVDWADAVLLWGSSVGLEALLADKTVLCLDYLNANRNIYEMLGAAWILHSRDDLALALAKLVREPNARPYAQAQVDLLLRDMVLAGGGEPVPERYIRFLSGTGETTHLPTG